MHKFDKKLIETLSQEACESERLRVNYLIHKSLEEKCQRMINVLMPGTVIPVQIHDIDETLILIKGRMIVTIYNDGRTVADSVELSQQGEVFGINILAGQIHGVEVLEPTVIFEVKEGPYNPIQTRNIEF